MHGSCGVGFGDTLEREQDHFHLHFSDLFNPTILEIKLEQIRKYYGMFHVFTELDMKPFMEAVELLNDREKFPNDAIRRVSKQPVSYETFVYEGSQGLHLYLYI